MNPKFFFVILLSLIFIRSPEILKADNFCASISVRDCYENHLDKCILIQRNGGKYSCRTPTPPCEANWRSPKDSYSDKPLIENLRKNCESDSKCKFEDPSCICPCDFDEGFSCDCICGGGLPARCVAR